MKDGDESVKTVSEELEFDRIRTVALGLINKRGMAGAISLSQEAGCSKEAAYGVLRGLESENICYSKARVYYLTSGLSQDDTRRIDEPLSMPVPWVMGDEAAKLFTDSAVSLREIYRSTRSYSFSGAAEIEKGVASWKACHSDSFSISKSATDVSVNAVGELYIARTYKMMMDDAKLAARAIIRTKRFRVVGLSDAIPLNEFTIIDYGIRSEGKMCSFVYKTSLL